MRVVAVLDLRGGQAVHAVAGQRDSYRPVRSKLAPSANPVALARAFREQLGLSELYVADLDAIAGKEPDWRTYAGLSEVGACLWVDAGLREAARAKALVESGVATVVAGLETLACPEALVEVIEAVGALRVAFSLDMKAGVLLCDRAAWGIGDALGAADVAVGLGIGRIIVLDLSLVGTSAGAALAAVCREIRSKYPDLEIAVGGGVRSADDLEAYRVAGADAVLVATALHTGAITREEIVRFTVSHGDSSDLL